MDYQSTNDPLTLPFAKQSVATGTAGVTSGHPLATKVGIDCLKKGGNAFDAIVSTAIALTVVEPTMSGMLGVGLAMLNPVGKESTVCNFSGFLPANFSKEKWFQHKSQCLSPYVPEAIHGWLAINEQYGSVSFSTLCEPAIELANNGFELNEANTYFLNYVLKHQPDHFFSEYYHNNKYKPGDRLVQKRTADALTLLSTHRKDIFKNRSFASALEKTFKDNQCILTLSDFNQRETLWQEPLSLTLFNHQVSVPPPNSDGFIILQAAKRLEEQNISSLTHNSAKYIDMIYSTLKETLEESSSWGGDPEHLKSDYSPLKHHTTSLLARDNNGNSVVMTQTLGGLFGDGLWVEKYGLPVNGLGSYFYLDDADQIKSRQLIPGFRIPWSVSLVQIFKNNQLRYMFGTPGGFTIYQSELQVLLNLLAFNMPLSRAIDKARFFIDDRNDITIENRVKETSLKALRGMGYSPLVLGDYTWLLGCMQGLDCSDETPTFISDSRRHGKAMTF